jgi:hypothetical protein
MPSTPAPRFQAAGSHGPIALSTEIFFCSSRRSVAAAVTGLLMLATVIALVADCGVTGLSGATRAEPTPACRSSLPSLPIE